MTPFAERLRAVMGAKRISRKALAARCDMSVSTVQKWMDGHSTPPAAALLVICDMAGCSLEWIMAPQPMDWVSTADAPQGKHAKYWVREAIAELRDQGEL